MANLEWTVFCDCDRRSLTYGVTSTTNWIKKYFRSKSKENKPKNDIANNPKKAEKVEKTEKPVKSENENPVKIL